MKSKTIISTFLLLLSAIPAFSQQKNLTLAEALAGAEKNYPAVKQKQLLQEKGKENERILDASLFPQVNAIGQATYQSEVTSFELPGSAKPIGQKADNYDIGLELRYPFTQFGVVQTRKDLEKAQTALGMSQVDVDVQKIRERVTGLYGNILLQKENEKILSIRMTDLDSQRKKIASGVANGAVLKSNQLVLESEILSTQQRIDDSRSTAKNLVSQLAMLTGISIDTTTNFQLPGTEIKNDAVNRPELKAFEAQKNILDLQSSLLKKENKPTLYLFGQGLYGRPGFNFLNTDLRPYGIAGIGLSWNLNNFFNQSKQQKVIDIQKEIVSSQEESFNLNLQTALSEKQSDIEKYESMLAKDAGIVQKRKEIIRAAASQLENGVITSTEYLTELNAENTAELNLILHLVQLSMAKAQYNTLTGY